MRVLFALGLMLCVVLSCTKIEQDVVEDGREIEFGAVVENPKKPGTKGIVGGNLYPDDMPFKSVAFYDAGDGAIPVAPVAWVPESTISRTDAGVWKVADKSYYWPKTGMLTFMAYSPASLSDTPELKTLTGVSMGVNGIGLSWNSEDADLGGIDFMVADLLPRQIGGTATMLFRHMLTQVSFYIKRQSACDKSVTVRLKSLDLVSVVTKADFKAEVSSTSNWWQADYTGRVTNSAFNYSWTPQTADAVNDIRVLEAAPLGNNEDYPIIMDDNDNSTEDVEEYVQIGSARLFIPQSFGEAGEIVLVYTHKPAESVTAKEIIVRLPITLGAENFKWEQAKHVKYFFTINDLHGIDFNVDTENWTSGGDISGTT